MMTTDDGKAGAGMSAGKDTAVGGAKLLIEVGPVVAFVIAYNVANRLTDGQGVFWATGVYMAAASAALAASWLTQRRVPMMLVVTTPIILVFGVLTLVFQSALFAYVKPTIINLLLASLIVGSLLVGRNIWKLFFGSVFDLPDRIWRILALRWAGWFVFLAILNEVVWRTTPEAFWANFKFFGVLPLTLLFALANTPITVKNLRAPEEPAEGAPPG